jgi:hypothetical protein
MVNPQSGNVCDSKSAHRDVSLTSYNLEALRFRCTWGASMGLYSHYDGAHNHPVNRALHMIAIPVGFSSIIVVWWHWIIGLLLIPTAFALAWLGHLIEGNKPAFLSNPAHVFVAPVWMAKKIFGRAGRQA